MLYAAINQSCYPPEVMQAFREGRAKDVLKKHLYSYREHTDDTDFHFLIGLCMLQMGYYEEAHAAFQKAQETNLGEGKRADIFDAFTMLMAQRDKEASDKISSVSLEHLMPSETVAVMAIKKELGLPVSEELKKVLSSHFQTEADRCVMTIFAFKYAGADKAAVSDAVKSIGEELFKDFQSYMYVIEELFKLHMTEEVDALLQKIMDSGSIASSAEKFNAYIRTAYACGFYERMREKFRETLFNYASYAYKSKKEPKSLWKESYSSICCMEYDRLEKAGLPRGGIVKKMRKLKEKSEQVLLYITAYDFENFSQSNPNEIRKNIEKLIEMDQFNLRYRKLYCDLLRVTGFLKQSDEVTKATISMRKKQENEEFSMVYAFHSFYMQRPCMLKYMPVHEHDDGKDCPVCFGAGSQPIIRAIGFGHSPSSIFTDNMEKHVIQPNEAMLRDIVNWQPMNVPSPIVAKYLLSLGAYMSQRQYPDVLVPGQTYLYISLKPESEERLKNEGYSMLQIDPYAVAMDAKGASDIEGKEIKDIPVSASDFTLEIIHAISPQEDLDSAPEMPMPEKYVPEENGGDAQDNKK